MVNLTEKMGNIWREIKNQPKDILCFYLFLLTFPLSIRKVVAQFPIKGAFNEYASAYVYLSDLFFLLTMLAGLFLIVNNKKHIMSSSKGYLRTLIHRLFCGKAVDNSDALGVSLEKITLIKAIKPYFHAILLGLIFIMLFDHYLWDIWQGQVLFWVVCGFLVGSESLNCSTWNIFKKGAFIIPLILVIWSFISVVWSENQLISLYRSARFFELYVLFMYISLRFVPRILNCVANCSTWNNLQHTDAKKCSTWNNLSDDSSENVPRGTFGIIMFVGVTQAMLGIIQVIIQHSVGLFWLRESIIAPNIAGVAKVIINHQAYIRAYGLFPHPNILGGFLFFSIIITLLYGKMFHVEHFKEQKNEDCSTWNNSERDNVQIVPRGTISHKLLRFVLAIQLLGLVCTASKSAILALIIALVYIIVPRGTIVRHKFNKMFHVEHFRIFIVMGLVALGGLFFFRNEVYGLFAKSFQERRLYTIISERIIADSPIVGVGTGQFTSNAEKLFPNLEVWQYQPVHNVFLLIWSEWGIVGLVLFILFLWKLFHINVPRGTILRKVSSPSGRGCPKDR